MTTDAGASNSPVEERGDRKRQPKAQRDRPIKIFRRLEPKEFGESWIEIDEFNESGGLAPGGLQARNADDEGSAKVFVRDQFGDGREIIEIEPID